VKRDVIHREIFLVLWTVHILHKTATGPDRNRLLAELRHHGYQVDLATLNPLLKVMTRRRWLRVVRRTSKKICPPTYHSTAVGRRVLEDLLIHIRKLNNGKMNC
jgi:hypothetical protein